MTHIQWELQRNFGFCNPQETYQTGNAYVFRWGCHPVYFASLSGLGRRRNDGQMHGRITLIFDKPCFLVAFAPQSLISCRERASAFDNASTGTDPAGPSGDLQTRLALPHPHPQTNKPTSRDDCISNVLIIPSCRNCANS